jgi:hypothetical protein
MNNLGTYSQRFIFFVTYKWAQNARVFTLTSPYSLAQCNILAYWAHLLVQKKIRCCEFSPWAVFITLYFLCKLQMGLKAKVFVRGKPFFCAYVM